MAARTSDTDPIYADWLEVAFPGRLGMTIAPGTKDHSSKGPRWDRDVEKDLDTLVLGKRRTLPNLPAHVLVCLLEDKELSRYGITSLEPSARARGLEFIKFEIPDTKVPSSKEAAAELVETILARLRAGKNVVVHCRGGIGRTGTIVGCVLSHEGIDADAAFHLMKTARKETMPENDAQRDFVRAYAKRQTAAPSTGSKAGPRAFDLIECLLHGSKLDLADARTRARTASVPGARSLVTKAEATLAKTPHALTFDETGYALLSVLDRTFSAGRFMVRTIGELRQGMRADGAGRVSVSAFSGASELTDIGSLQAHAAEGTLFQAASQFNCLEAPGASMVKVADYFGDSTQGPRASISAFPGTLLRHYAATGEDGARFVQTPGKQVNLLARALPSELGAVESGYLMTQNLPDPSAAAKALEEHFDQIAVGVHDGTQVVFGNNWDGAVDGAPRIAQVFTSSLAAGGYSRGGDKREVEALCRPLLRAAYLGTLLAAARLGKRRVLLTLIGGGVFGNPASVIWESIFWAADAAAGAGAVLQVVVNTHMSGAPSGADAECKKRGGRVVVVS